MGRDDSALIRQHAISLTTSRGVGPILDLIGDVDVVLLSAFVWVKASTDTLGIIVAVIGIVVIVAGERLFMRSHTRPDGTMAM